MAKNNGGPAFPGPGEIFVNDPHGGISPQSAYGMEGAPGMSLRDYFAAKALQSILTWSDWCKREGESFDEAAARMAYEYADCMLAAREK